MDNLNRVKGLELQRFFPIEQDGFIVEIHLGDGHPIISIAINSGRGEVNFEDISLGKTYDLEELKGIIDAVYDKFVVEEAGDDPDGNL